jgi:transcription-repair coupling factor (superfamily II helicase)
VIRLRLLAQQWQIDSVHLEDGYAVFTYLNRQRIEQLAALRKKRLRIVDDRSVYLPLPKTPLEPDALVELLESMLLPA